MAGGRPSTYNENRHPLLVRWMARGGATDEEIAEAIGISVRSLYKWYKDYPELYQAKKDGLDADMKVEEGLLKRALGFKVKETSIKQTPKGEKFVTVTEKEVAPDAVAAIFWLKNRRPDRWQDVNKLEHSGQVTQKHEDSQLEKKLKEDPESADLLKQLYRRSVAVEGAGKG